MKGARLEETIDKQSDVSEREREKLARPVLESTGASRVGTFANKFADN